MSDREVILKSVRANRCLIIRLGESEFCRFAERRSMGRSFTMAVSPEITKDVRVPTVCLIFSKQTTFLDEVEDLNSGHIGVVAGKRPLTAIEYGIRVTHSTPIDPESLNACVGLVRGKRAINDFARRLSATGSVISLPPDLTAQLSRALAERPQNRAALSRAATFLRTTRTASPMRQLQADAIQSALEIFGLPADTAAITLQLPEGQKSELSKYWLQEDSVIEYDARQIPGLALTNVHVTGRAEFRRGSEILEVITANRRPLERVFGVDLIYHNVVRNSLVMVQYKMLNPHPNRRTPGVFPDWIYRPDRKLSDEISRMHRFRKSLPAAPGEYRLTPEMFYMKFVRRDKIGLSAAITIPLEHFEQLRSQPAHKGPRGALRVSYKALNGSYLRDDAFFNLIRAGYIGASATTTAVLLPLIRRLIDGDRAVVVAVQKLIP